MVTKISASYTGLEKPCNVLSLDGDHRSLIKFQTELECETIIFRIKQFLKRTQMAEKDEGGVIRSDPLHVTHLFE
jgi:hypothetical protein